jgi:hypothetical protein
MDEKNTAVSKQEIVDKIFNDYNIQISKEWVNIFVKKHSDSIEIVTATPLEISRASITKEEMETHIIKLKEWCSDIHPLLLINCDETGIGSTKKNYKKCHEVMFYL